MKVSTSDVLCLDTYALWEISKGNPKFQHLNERDFVIPDPILAEFYWALLLEYNKPAADYWFRQMSPYTKPVDKYLMAKAMNFRYQRKKQNLSFFDCVGYIYSQENNIKFVTGDKEFEKMPGVLFIKK